MMKLFKSKVAVGVLVAVNLTLSSSAFAHCDVLDGPVITEAQAALEKKNVEPLLKWVPQESEGIVKESFSKALRDRASNKAAQEVADWELFETLVRVHREAEGETFTGLKPAGEIAPMVVEADKALVNKSVDKLAKHIAIEVEKSIKEKFEKAMHTKKSVDQSSEKGREYVSSYVQYVHFVEALSNMLAQSEHAHH